MENNTREKLLKLNEDFYSTFSASFSATRKGIQPGVKQLLGLIGNKDQILDLGCGNGNFARALADINFDGSYLGLDSNPVFLSFAVKGLPPASAYHYAFIEQDLADPSWPDTFLCGYFDVITAFSFLQHIPGKEYQAAFFTRVSDLLTPGGLLMLSVWQPLNDCRLKDHILPWEMVDLSPESLCEGDLLIDWRAEENAQPIGMRYVHQFSAEELTLLGSSAGLKLELDFYSDGRTHNLGYYQVWRKL